MGKKKKKKKVSTGGVDNAAASEVIPQTAALVLFSQSQYILSVAIFQDRQFIKHT